MSKKKPLPRVLWVVSSLLAGGAERMICELANAFAEHGHVSGLLTLSEPGDDHYRLDERVTRIKLDLIWDSCSRWQSLVSNLRRNRMIREAVRRFEPDVVVSFIEQTNIRMLAALVGTGIPLIVSERIDPRHYRVGRGWELLRRGLYPLAKRVVVQTKSVAEWANDLVPERRVCVIPNFVREQAKPADTLQGRGSDILAVGRLDTQKGFDLLLRAFAASRLAERGRRLTILGEGPERETLAELARQLGVEYAVSMPGVVKDPENWMARSALFVLPSRYEGFPNALLEAMTMGCAVIASDCDSGPGEIIQDGENGVLVPVEDIEALTGQLIRLMEDLGLRTKLSNAASSVCERFEKQAILRQWRDLIEEVLQS